MLNITNPSGLVEFFSELFDVLSCYENDITLTKKKIYVKITCFFGLLNIINKVKTNSIFEVNTIYCGNNADNNISKALAVIAVIILAMFKAFFFIPSSKTKTNHKKLTIIFSMRRKIPILSFDVSSRVYDFNRIWFCFISAIDKQTY